MEQHGAECERRKHGRYYYDGAGLRYGKRVDGGAMTISLYEYDRVILEEMRGDGRAECGESRGRFS